MVKLNNFIYIFTLLLIFTSCKKDKSENIIQTENGFVVNESGNRIILSNAQFENGKMSFAKLEERMLANTLNLNGFIDVPPNNRAMISALAGGYIKSLKPIVGTQVKKGDLLLTIENLDFVNMQQNLLEISEKLEFLENEFNRQKTLFDEKISSEKNYLNAQSDFKSAQATYLGLKKKLEMLNFNVDQILQGNISASAPILAPISGTVSSVEKSTGAFVLPNEPILEIVNEDHIHLELQAFEKDVLRLRPKQTLWFNLSSEPDKKYEAEIYLIGNTLSEDRTVKVHAHIREEGKQHFVVGMFVNAAVNLEEKMSVSIDERAIVKLDNGNYLLKLIQKDNQYELEKIKVELLDIRNNLAILKEQEGLTGSDEFLVGGNILLIESD